MAGYIKWFTDSVATAANFAKNARTVVQTSKDTWQAGSDAWVSFKTWPSVHAFLVSRGWQLDAESPPDAPSYTHPDQPLAQPLVLPATLPLTEEETEKVLIRARLLPMATATSLPRASVRPKQRYALVYLFTLWTLFLCLTTTSLRASAVPWRLATGLAPGCMQGRMQQLGAVVWRRSAGGLNTFQDAVRYIFCAWDYLIWAIVELITWTFQTTRTAVELRVVNVEKKGWRYFWTPMEYPPVAKFPGVTWTAPEPATASGSVLSTSLPGAGLRNGQAG